MIRLFRRWFGLRCLFHCCGGVIGMDFGRDGSICWRCSDCGKVVS